MIFVGESFMEVSEEFAIECMRLFYIFRLDLFFCLIIYINADCNKKQETLQKKIDGLEKEEKIILERQAVLKKDLYGKFGDSINLES